MGDGDAYPFNDFYVIKKYKAVSKRIYAFLLVLQ